MFWLFKVCGPQIAMVSPNQHKYAMSEPTPKAFRETTTGFASSEGIWRWERFVPFISVQSGRSMIYLGSAKTVRGSCVWKCRLQRQAWLRTWHTSGTRDAAKLDLVRPRPQNRTTVKPPGTNNCWHRHECPDNTSNCFSKEIEKTHFNIYCNRIGKYYTLILSILKFLFINYNCWKISVNTPRWYKLNFKSRLLF